MEERDVLAHSHKTEWFPKLFTAFQDSETIYLVMEFAAGGDLLSFLAMQGDIPVLEEEAAKFYIAEVILAVDFLHLLGYVHR